MISIIVLDSAPLGLILQQRDYDRAQRCREWARAKAAAGVRLLVPEIVYYELRRELLRLGNQKAVGALAQFTHGVTGRYVPISTAAMDLAAELWAKTRRQGKPTADPHALDVDVILAAQVLASGLDPADFVVATSNVSHVALFVPAATWESL